jgi:predicted translin family RNA/ssDNA-binding protein
MAMAAANSSPTQSTPSSPPESSFVDAEAWDALQSKLKQHDEQRETVIKRSRDVQKAAKQAIFALHRGDGARASALLRDASVAVRELRPLVDADPMLRHGGSFSSALEELAEAIVFKGYLEGGRVPSPAAVAGALGGEGADDGNFELTPDEFLGGVLDFTGELNRFAVARATARDAAAVARCRDCVEVLLGRFLGLDLRNGQLRKKYDGLKYCLRNLENTLYELRLAEDTGKALALAAAGGAPRGGGGGGGADEEDDEGGGGGRG